MRSHGHNGKETGIPRMVPPAARREFGAEDLSTQTERRRTPRAKPYGLVYLSLSSENGGIVVDASEGGLQFQAVAPVEPSDGSLKVWFTLNSSNRIEAVGQIVWTDQSKRLGGLQFTSLADPARLSIRKWLEQSAATASRDESGETTASADAEIEAIVPQPWTAALDELDADVTAPFPSEKSVKPRESANGSGNGASVAPPTPTPAPSRPAPSPFIVASAPAVSPAPAAPAAPTARERTPEIRTAEKAPEIKVAEKAPEIKVAGKAPEVAAPIRPVAPVAPVPSVADGRTESDRAILESLTGGSSRPSVRESARSNDAVADSPWRPAERPAENKEPAVRGLSYEGAAFGSPYSGREHESILSEVQKAAQHRIDESMRQESRARISVQNSDLERPWRPSMMTLPPEWQKREKLSRLAEFLSNAGVSREMVRTLETMILVVAFVGVAGIGAFLFRRQIGQGVQWMGREVSNRNSAAISDQSPSEPSPVDLDISPLLKPPPGVPPAARPVAAKPKPKAAVSEAPAAGNAVGAASASVGTGAASTEAFPTGPDDSGDAALATGLQYLREDGGPTVTNVAVKWLWAAVEKGNTKAAIILADLYTWGRGVPQNCEQARVLLITASKRGSVEAVQRLQDMEADGCSNAKSVSQ